MVPVIIPAYAAVLVLIYIGLSVRVIRGRQSYRVGFGAGDSVDLERRIRVHGNFAEYVPLAVIMLAFMELQGHPAWLLHLCGLVLIAGRVAHAFGISQETEDFRLRSGGVTATFAVLIVAALSLLARAF
jgi:uncharacterized membrane protein YecN with MAPEG domain